MAPAGSIQSESTNRPMGMGPGELGHSMSSVCYMVQEASSQKGRRCAARHATPGNIREGHRFMEGAE